jgi:hypothetical protein
MLAVPGDATIANIDTVDVQVRRVGERPGVCHTAGLDLNAARPLIQKAWNTAVARFGAPGSLHLSEHVGGAPTPRVVVGVFAQSRAQRRATRDDTSGRKPPDRMSEPSKGSTLARSQNECPSGSWTGA